MSAGAVERRRGSCSRYYTYWRKTMLLLLLGKMPFAFMKSTRRERKPVDLGRSSMNVSRAFVLLPTSGALGAFAKGFLVAGPVPAMMATTTSIVFFEPSMGGKWL